MTLVRSLFVWLCCLAALAPARGRSEDQIVTDRPDFVESSLTVGKGRFQVETSSHLRQSDDGHRYAAGILGATLDHNWTERLHTFVEVAGRQLAPPADGGNVITYGRGAAYLIVPTVQVDTGMFIGANHHTPDVAWTIGLSAKF